MRKGGESPPAEAAIVAELEAAVHEATGVVLALLRGQVLERQPTRRRFARVARHLRAWGLNARLREAEKAYFQTAVVPAERLMATLRLVSLAAQQVAESVSSAAMARPGKAPPSVTLAKEYVSTHLTDHLTEREVARQSHVNPFYLSRAFKSLLAMGCWPAARTKSNGERRTR